MDASACVEWIDSLMGSNSSRPSGGAQSRSRYPQERSFSKGAWSTRGRRRRQYGEDEGMYDEPAMQQEYPQHQAYAPFPNMQQQAYYSQQQYMPGQPPPFPQPPTQAGANPVIPPIPMTGAIPTTGNPFPAPPMNIAGGGPDGAGYVPMPEPVIPGAGQNPEAPVIPPFPSSHRGRAGTPYHHPSSAPWDSSDSESYDDELTPQTRERLQPPLAPGQYGPFDGMRNRRATPAPALRRDRHRRAESSPVFGRGPEDRYPQGPEPPVIPHDVGRGYGPPPFPQPQGGPMYQQPEPIRREPTSTYRPPPLRSPIRFNHNPLPPPPRDIFQSSPYSRLLRELKKPIDETAIKARLAGSAAIHTVGAVPIPTVQPEQHHRGTRSSREKKRKGLFRSLSSRLHSHRDGDDDGDMASPLGGVPPQAFVGGQSTTVYPIMQTLPDGSITLTYNPPPAQGATPMPMPMAGGGAPASSVVPPVMPGYVPSTSPALPPGFVPVMPAQFQPQARAPSPGPARMPTPQPAAPPEPPPRRVIKLDPEGRYAALLHTSPHQVHYDHKSYPTLLHLLEALRFLPNNPQCAEEIRRCRSVAQAVETAGNMHHLWRQDWYDVFENLLDDALYAKFMQHPRLRTILLETGDAELVYAEPGDTFWGDGGIGQGLNHLGRALMRVRDRLRAEEVYIPTES